MTDPKKHNLTPSTQKSRAKRTQALQSALRENLRRRKSADKLGEDEASPNAHEDITLKSS